MSDFCAMTMSMAMMMSNECDAVLTKNAAMIASDAELGVFGLFVYDKTANCQFYRCVLAAQDQSDINLIKLTVLLLL